MKNIKGIIIPDDFKVVQNGANYLLVCEQIIIKIMFFNKEQFENNNPGVSFQIHPLKNNLR